MNKVVKVISILLIAIMLVASLPQVSFAGSKTPTTDATTPEGAISSFTSGIGYQSDDVGKLNDVAVRVLKAIRNVAIIAAVLVISVVGVKYMVGSVEEKAKYKEVFLPLIVGAVLVVAAAQIATMLFSLGG